MNPNPHRNRKKVKWINTRPSESVELFKRVFQMSPQDMLRKSPHLPEIEDLFQKARSQNWVRIPVSGKVIDSFPHNGPKIIKETIRRCEWSLYWERYQIQWWGENEHQVMKKHWRVSSLFPQDKGLTKSRSGIPLPGLQKCPPELFERSSRPRKVSQETQWWKALRSSMPEDLMLMNTDKNLGMIMLRKEIYESVLKDALPPLTRTRSYPNYPFLKTALDKGCDEAMKWIAGGLKQRVNQLPQKEEKFDMFCSTYAIMKIHKTELKARPIVSFRRTRYEKSLSLLASYLVDIIQWPSFILFSTQDVRIPESCGWRAVGSIDFTAMYTNLDLKRALNMLLVMVQRSVDACTYARYETMVHPFVSRLCANTIILDSSKYQFKIKEGIPMGNPLSPVLAMVSIIDLEEIFLRECEPRVEDIWYGRYLDDILIASKGCELQVVLDIFQETLNGRAAYTVDERNPVKFLDVFIHLEKGRFRKYPAMKELSQYDFVPSHSLHAKGTLDGIVRSQFMRLLRNASNIFDPEVHHALAFLQLVLVCKFQYSPWRLKKILYDCIDSLPLQGDATRMWCCPTTESRLTCSTEFYAVAPLGYSQKATEDLTRWIRENYFLDPKFGWKHGTPRIVQVIKTCRENVPKLVSAAE